MALTTGSIFWQNRANEGRPFDPATHIHKVLEQRKVQSPLPANDADPQVDPEHRSVDPSGWQGKPIFISERVVDGLIPVGHVTGQYGDGAVGKTTLMFQLLAVAAFEHSWLGWEVWPLKGCGPDSRKCLRRYPHLGMISAETKCDHALRDGLTLILIKGQSDFS